MGEVIEFHARKARTPRAGDVTGNAEIVIFPGVRIERREFPPPALKPMTRNRRTARNQAVEFKRE